MHSSAIMQSKPTEKIARKNATLSTEKSSAFQKLQI
jgi:hypothetical protein